ncbi:HAMP domain-containing sensor histidine kinase [Frigidibacter sp. MR17.14]|uniref:sensor histidine kinase n=1 Tax=Frigidibacter sp. MR17.14 TaxID=3126509 RepID=UPI003012BCCB
MTAVRWLGVAIVLLALILNGIGLYRIQSSLDQLSDSRRGGALWAAMQLELEFLRLERSLAGFVAGADQVTADDIRLRFDILWSRNSIAANGTDGRNTVSTAGAQATLDELASALHQEEDRVGALKDGDVDSARQILTGLAPYGGRIHDYLLAAKNEQSDLDALSRDQLLLISRIMVFLSFAVGVASLIVVAMFFIDSRRHQQFSAQNAALLEASRAAYKAKSQFLSTVSHELRTPLTSIKGSLGILKSGVLGEVAPRALKLVNTAYDNTERLVMLINDILDLEKSETGVLSYRFAAMDAGQLVGRSIEACRSYKPERKIRLEADVETKDLMIRGDDGRMMQVMSNLISNAIKFSHPEGTVRITARRVDGAVELAVQDSGVGISEAFVPQVFEKFTQEDGSDTRSQGGTGLGLSITKRIVEDHGGKISLTSQLGEGTTFFVRLPVLEAASNAA